MTAKRMGGMGKLSDFGKTVKPQPQVKPVEQPEASKYNGKAKKPEEKLVTVNIKISRSQQEWLADTARAVRDNNSEPVPPNERVFPQHLIGVAIDLLEQSDVDWNQIRNIDELRQQLKL